MRTLLLIIAIVCWSYPAALQAASVSPNIVVIYADDLGYGDIQCYNPKRGKIPTPHVDKLASQGMRFTDAHSSSGVCSPSRYTILTGRYHWRVGQKTRVPYRMHWQVALGLGLADPRRKEEAIFEYGLQGQKEPLRHRRTKGSMARGFLQTHCRRAYCGRL